MEGPFKQWRLGTIFVLDQDDIRHPGGEGGRAEDDMTQGSSTKTQKCSRNGSPWLENHF